MTFEKNGIMTDTEKQRKTFQSVGSDGRVEMIWGLVQGMIDGDDDDIIGAVESGSVCSLTDLMPDI